MPSNSLNMGGSPAEPEGEPAERLNEPAEASGHGDRLNIRLELSELWDCEFLFMSEEEFDKAIIGIMEKAGGVPVVAYDTTIILSILKESMTAEEAEEYFDYNIIGAYFGEKTPVFITRLETI